METFLLATPNLVEAQHLARFSSPLTALVSFNSQHAIVLDDPPFSTQEALQ